MMIYGLRPVLETPQTWRTEYLRGEKLRRKMLQIRLRFGPEISELPCRWFSSGQHPIDRKYDDRQLPVHAAGYDHRSRCLRTFMLTMLAAAVADTLHTGLAGPPAGIGRTPHRLPHRELLHEEQPHGEQNQAVGGRSKQAHKPWQLLYSSAEHRGCPYLRQLRLYYNTARITPVSPFTRNCLPQRQPCHDRQVIGEGRRGNIRGEHIKLIL